MRLLQPGTPIGVIAFCPSHMSDWKLVVQLEASAPGASVGFVVVTS